MINNNNIDNFIKVFYWHYNAIIFLIFNSYIDNKEFRKKYNVFSSFSFRHFKNRFGNSTDLDLNGHIQGVIDNQSNSSGYSSTLLLGKEKLEAMLLVED